MLGLRDATPVETRTRERLRALRIRYVVAPAKRLELLATPLAHRLDELGIAVAHKILKGIRLAVLLAHEQQRHVRRQQEQCSRKPALPKPDRRCEAIADGAISDLIVILDACYETIARN